MPVYWRYYWVGKVKHFHNTCVLKAACTPSPFPHLFPPASTQAGRWCWLIGKVFVVKMIAICGGLHNIYIISNQCWRWLVLVGRQCVLIMITFTCLSFISWYPPSFLNLDVGVGASFLFDFLLTLPFSPPIVPSTSRRSQSSVVAAAVPLVSSIFPFSLFPPAKV